MHQIADAVDVEDDGILAVGVDDALELADHGWRLFPPRRAGKMARAAGRKRQVWGRLRTCKPGPVPTCRGWSAPRALRRSENITSPLIAPTLTVAEQHALPVVRVRDRDGERVGGVIGGRIGLGQQHADHHPDLRLVAVADADDALLHQVRRIFGDRHAGHCRHHHGDAARLAELERRVGVLVDEGGLDRRLVGAELVEDAHQAVVNGKKPYRQCVPVVGGHRAAGEKDEPVAGNLDHAPAGAAEPRIDAENANWAASCRPGS